MRIHICDDNGAILDSVEFEDQRIVSDPVATRAFAQAIAESILHVSAEMTLRHLKAETSACQKDLICVLQTGHEGGCSPTFQVGRATPVPPTQVGD